VKKHLSIILFCLCAVLAVSYLSYADKTIGSVLKVKKKVYRIRDRKKLPAKPKMPLALKDSVETGKHARAKLSFRDNSIIILGELTKMDVKKYVSGSLKKKSKSVYMLIDGSLRVIVGRSDLKIHTLSALVAARGTEFIVWMGKDGGKVFTGVIMLEGETTAESSVPGVKGKETVRRGQMCRIFVNEPPEKPRPIDVKLMEKFTGTFGAMQSTAETSGKSEVTGKVLNEADIKDTSNVAVGEGSEANTGSVVME
jgi:hypothetical protein